MAAVLRDYEAAGQPARANITLGECVTAAREVNLREDSGRKLPITGNALELDLRPFEIKTIRLRF